MTAGCLLSLATTFHYKTVDIQLTLVPLELFIISLLKEIYAELNMYYVKVYNYEY